MIDTRSDGRDGETTGAWQRFGSDRRGLAGIWLLGGLVLMAVSAPLLANRLPILCWYRGALYFPAVADATQRFKTAKNELIRLKDPREEYSALVIAILKSKRCVERPWIDRLFL